MIRIAIVEDHVMVREGIKMFINQVEDMQVVAEFDNGVEWLNSFGSQHYDVSLVDINMPQLNGLDALGKALQIQPDHQIIMLSMHHDVNYFKEAFVKGAKGFVLKDMSVEELAHAIRLVNEGQTYFSDEFLKAVASSLKSEREEEKVLRYEAGELHESEQQLLTLICKGYTNKELAEALFLSVKAIESQKTKLLRKTGSRNNAGLIVWAIKHHIVKI
ncbi:response regulator transcription factor [Carboxylicivirga mesophila]|uniref:Response regulator transcription factor n=1 Tax=Carboxylicivirga mesophila TaxID=1166478 RepID=A0ABS5KB44_9BACT|nr:response regulator transcription factor [Carboxylicivirga mesophila]MBS2212259.1 response regulator transcription factor [Carboxylicivirga mesophila]